MKPSEYQIGGKDSIGNTVKSILGRSGSAVVYCTETKELRWEYDDDGKLPPNVEPAVRRFDELLARLRASAMTAQQKEVAYVLLGQCLFRALDAGDPSTNDENFRSIEDFLTLNSPPPARQRMWIIRKLPKVGWPARVAAVLLLALGAGTIWAWTDAWRSSQILPQATLCDAKSGANELVVMVHGFTGSKDRMNAVIQAVQQRRPDADILFFSYPASLCSNADPFKLADKLEREIASMDKPQYKRIILSGHSMGASLIRKAYVYGCGCVEDLPLAGAGSTTRAPREWCKKVDRLVLLAGMNRGWNLDTRAEDWSWIVARATQLAVRLARRTGTAKFIRSFERGEPFVANLRLQWLDAMAKARREDGWRRPVVIQLLGDKDDVVSTDDSRDVSVARDFIWVGVNNSDHSGILQVSDDGDGLERKHRIQSAFGDQADIDALKQANPVLEMETDPDVTTVVFVLHGIRDMGAWTSQFKKPLEEGFAKQHPGTNEKIYVYRAAYGYFPMGAFLLLNDRQQKVRWFMDQVTELKARFPKLQHIHFIGHSNGTYVLASALQNYRTLRVERVVFAGSVVRRDFPWSQFRGRVKGVRNYVGSADWVVGFFPKLFELPWLAALNPDLGSAGYDGFEDGFVKDDETQFIRGEHSAALVESNVQSVVDFVLEGKKTDVPALVATEHPRLLDLCSRLCWLVWLVIILMVLALGRLVTLFFSGRLVRWSPRGKGRLALAIYCLIVLALLYTL